MIITIDNQAATPIYLQIKQQIMIGVTTGELLPNEKLPTVRELATALSINPMTVNKVYQQLKEEQIIVASGRNGVRISPHPYKENMQPELHALSFALAELKLQGMTRRQIQASLEILLDQIYSQED